MWRWMVSLGVLLVVGTALFFLASHHAANVARPRVTAALARMAKYADVDYEDVRVDLLRRVAHVSNLKIRPIRTEATALVRDVEIIEFEDGRPFPARLDVVLHGIGVDDAATAQVMPSVEQALLLGEQIDGAIRLAYRYSKDEGVLSLRALELTIEGLGTIGVSAEFINVTVPEDASRQGDLGPAGLRALSDALEDAALGRAELFFEDRGLLARAAIVSGASTEESARALALQLTDELSRQFEEGGATLPAPAREQLEEFINNPGSVRVTVAAKVPIPLARFVMGAMLGDSPDPDIRVDMTPGEPLSKVVGVQAARVRETLARLARTAMDESRWDDAAGALGRARTITPDDARIRELQEELTLRSGIEFDIRKVDFWNRSYAAPECVRESISDGGRLRDPIRVDAGLVSVGSGPNEFTFSVDDVLHGDVDGDGVPDAVVAASCGHVQTSARRMHAYVYGLRHGEPVLMAALSEDRIRGDYGRAHGEALWPPLGIALSNGRLVVRAGSGGSRARPAYDAQLEYAWGPSGLTLAAPPARAAFGTATATAARR